MLPLAGAPEKKTWMYDNLRLAQKYIHYYRTASNGRGHGMHSPFVFDLILHVLNNAGAYHPPSTIEERRRQLLHDRRRLAIQDLGAGSRVHADAGREVRTVARTALKSPRLAKLLYRLARHYRPQHILELGTSLGITTAYLSAAVPGATIVTMEGSAAIAAVARESFQVLGARNIHLLEGNFDQLLPQALAQNPSVDLAYVDGNHRYAPTMDYFRQLLSAAHPGTILVFDDIHWSAEMEKAWAEIRGHRSVTCTIDLFFLGFVFFRPGFREKQNFTIRF